MDRGLYNAAVSGSIVSLLELLGEDELILDRALVGSALDNPLHIAAILGHVDFAGEILARRREFAFELDSQGFSPLHLAAAKGYLDMVNLLLKIDPSGEICLVRDRDGRTPLHSAAVRGRLAVLRRLLRAKPEAGRARTDRGETILHLSLKHNHWEMVKWMLEWADESDDGHEFLNMRDDDGNTVLHISTAKKQIQMLLNKSKVELNATNIDGLTALDVLDAMLQRNPSELSMINRIGKILEDAGATRGRRLSPITHEINTTTPNNNCHHTMCGEEKQHKGWVGERSSALIVVAILISTVTFEAGLNPPSCKWMMPQGGSKKLLIATTQKNALTSATSDNMIKLDYGPFMVIDTIGFLVSLSIIILLISKPPLRPAILNGVLTVLLWVSVSSVALTFAYYIQALVPSSYFATNAPFLWLGLLYLWQLFRFALWLLRVCGIVKKKKNINSGGDIEMGIGEHT